jgi:hypothetical protein
MEMEQGDDVTIAFQIEAFTNSDGSLEIVKIECELTTAEPSQDLEAEELGVGSWEFRLVVPADFDETYPPFQIWALRVESASRLRRLFRSLAAHRRTRLAS